MTSFQDALGTRHGDLSTRHQTAQSATGQLVTRSIRDACTPKWALHASPLKGDASAPTFAQVVTRVTRTSHIAENKGVTRVTRSPRFRPIRARIYAGEAPHTLKRVTRVTRVTASPAGAP